MMDLDRQILRQMITTLSTNLGCSQAPSIIQTTFKADGFMLIHWAKTIINRPI